MEEIIQFDKQLLLMVNGSDSVFLDYVVLTLTNAKTWIPLYLGLFYVVVMTHKPNWRDILLILAAAGLCVLLAGTIDDTIVKPLVARWRPTHDPQIGALVDVVNDYRGGNYGFFSALLVMRLSPPCEPGARSSPTSRSLSSPPMTPSCRRPWRL